MHVIPFANEAVQLAHEFAVAPRDFAADGEESEEKAGEAIAMRIFAVLLCHHSCQYILLGSAVGIPQQPDQAAVQSRREWPDFDS